MSETISRKLLSIFRQKLFGYLLCTLLIATLTSSCGVVEKVKDLIDSISDGASCEEDYTCFGGRCLKRRDGFPGGYCTTLDCDTRGCSGLASECFRTQVGGKSVAACYEMCEFDGTCKRAREGYTCVSLEDVQVCLPPGVSTGIAQGAIGSSCTNNLQCGEEGTCLTNLFGGYCTKLSCDGSATCPDKSTCLLLNPEADKVDQVAGCLATCSTSKDCRFGYSCQTYEGSQVCLEGDEPEEPRNPDGKDDGAPCVANINCKGGTCIREVEGAEGQISFPDGYCTTRGCKDDNDCHGTSVCVSRQRSTVCMESCTGNNDCREGYQCKSGNEGRGFCDSTVEYIAPDTSGAASDPFDVQCGTSKALKFTVPAGAIGFYIAPFTEDGRRINLTTLELPDNSVLNIRKDYGFAAVNSEILETLSPILFPASNQANLKDRFVGGGNYTLNVETNSSKICYYVIPKMKPGTTLDITVYLVGVRGVTAATAPSNTNMQAVVKTMQSIYSSMGITARVANYVDPSQATLDSYSLVRDINDIFTLVATSQAQGTTPDDSLAVNVFLINDFAVSEVPGLLGVSAGLPGMAGMHGNSGSGLVFSTASLGRDNEMLGLTMAHEIGHFLGLRHTTEHGGSAHDPITDTPTCIYPDLGYFCPDAKNFMFPFSLGKDQRKTTPGQSFVIQRSPLVK